MNSHQRERVTCIITRCKQRAELVGFEAKTELEAVAADLERFLAELGTMPSPGPVSSNPPSSATPNSP